MISHTLRDLKELEVKIMFILNYVSIEAFTNAFMPLL